MSKAYLTPNGLSWQARKAKWACWYSTHIRADYLLRRMLAELSDNRDEVRNLYYLVRRRNEVFQCQICNKPECKLVVDHIVPITHPHVQGLHVIANLQVISACANQIKSNKFSPDQFDLQVGTVQTKQKELRL